MRLHIVHIAVEPLRQPLHQTRLGRGQIDTGHTDLGKSQLLRPRPYLRNPLTAAIHLGEIVKTPPAPAAPTTLYLQCSSEADTAAFAQQLAQAPGIRQAFITLHGDLGAGKTTLVRHLLHALGVQGRIKSPTYAVVEPHQGAHPKGADLDIWHFDFYRFSDPREWEDAGFRDIFASPGLKLAEWPENAAGLAPTADLAIYIEVNEAQERRVELHAHSPLGLTLLQGLHIS